MITILSPAKSLNFKNLPQTKKYSQSDFLKESSIIISKLQKFSSDEIRELMKISNGLGELNFIRFQNWEIEHNINNAKQAILTFNGEVYNGLKASTISEGNMLFTQKNIRILSGLYGILRPLDLIQAYRLEMGTKLQVNKHKNLYSFWGEKIFNTLSSELQSHKHPFIINLASNEYSKSALLKKFNNNVITPVFKENKNDSYKVITVYAKKARGLMTRFIIDKKLNNPKDLKVFDMENYAYSDNLSTDTEWVFTR